MELSEQLYWLSNGLHPITKEALPTRSLTHLPEAQRYLNALATEILELEEAGGFDEPTPTPNEKRKKPKYRKFSEEERIARTHKNHKEGLPLRSHFPWSEAEDEAVVVAFQAEVSVAEIAKNQQRSIASIEAKLKNLGFLIN